MKLFSDFANLSGEGSRKAQAFGGSVLLILAKPELAWPIVAVTAAYILGRAIHDAATAGIE
jgi:hypothetical protein